MPLFTGRGDEGETDLLGSRVSKDHHRIEVLGTLDELNAVLGLALTALPAGPDARLLDEVQNDLFTMGAELAVAPAGESPPLASPLDSRRVRVLETGIARLEGEIGPQKAFVLPGGSPAAARLHHARAVVRRAERRAVALASREEVNPEILRYLNRLSSLLHAMALGANQEAGVEERRPSY
ncbi:MAG: cob(I)yrinic acid a,c-diamide adenosyltransferase [Thermoplasmata archaeon]